MPLSTPNQRQAQEIATLKKFRANKLLKPCTKLRGKPNFEKMTKVLPVVYTTIIVTVFPVLAHGASIVSRNIEEDDVLNWSPAPSQVKPSAGKISAGKFYKLVS